MKTPQESPENAAAREARKARRATDGPLAGWRANEQKTIIAKEFRTDSSEAALSLARRMLVLAVKMHAPVEVAYDGGSALILRMPTPERKVSKPARALARRVQRSATSGKGAAEGPTPTQG
ncbi:MAG TPA: hypothetical protein VG166_07595 [Caulobacteraceae bacterium]|nr:hypothetical protein [Caulobacteraceae bacterium]